jgi:hypothetical protein
MVGMAGMAGYSGSAGSPLLLDALTKSREMLAGRVQNEKGPAQWSPLPEWLARRELPPGEEPASLQRLDPNIRGYLAEQELLSHLHFTPPAGRRPATLRWIAGHRFGSNGAVRATATEIVTMTRPKLSVFEAQLKVVESWAERREDRASEILVQVLPQISFWSSVVNLHPNRTPKTLEFIDVALQFAMLMVMRFKHALGCPRPIEYSPNIQPVLLTPGYATLPSGHATEAYMFARVMRRLMGQADDSETARQLDHLAARIAENRVVAGLHFPADSTAGRLLGDTLAGLLVSWCTGNHRWQARAFKGDRMTDKDREFQRDESLDPGAGFPAYFGSRTHPSLVPQNRSVLRWMWQQAQEEWTQAGFQTGHGAPAVARNA